LSCWRVLAHAVVVAALTGCATIHNEPANRPMTVAPSLADVGREGLTYSDELLVGLAFSGGGTRAAAFSYGALTEIDRTSLRGGGKPGSLLDRVDFVSGVSGGSVIAAYYGLRRREALADFRERFLLRDAEESLSTRLSPIAVSRAYAGGINDSEHLPRWLDQNLFNGATFGEFRSDRRPRVWINAADIYNRTPFVFGHLAFNALCSDLSSYRIADAVAASAAVPVLFAPVVIESFAQSCSTPLPPWIERVRNNPTASPMLKTFAEATARYRNGSMRYIKLLDGGLVRRMDADRRRPERARVGDGGGRYRHRRQRARELHRLRAHHVRVAAGSCEVALRSARRRAGTARRRRRMELSRSEVLHRPRQLRSARAGTCRRAQCGGDALQAAGRNR
jgi:NTE family protein